VFKQFKINKDLPTPVYLQLKTNILDAIAAAEIKIDTALPSERELANYLGLSRMTVRRAFDELVNEHYLERRQGSGTYILPKPVEQTMDRVLGFSDEAKTSLSDLIIKRFVEENDDQPDRPKAFTFQPYSTFGQSIFVGGVKLLFGVFSNIRIALLR